MKSLALDASKVKTIQTTETLESITNQGYKNISELTNLKKPSSYYYHPEKNRLFNIGLADFWEVEKAETKKEPGNFVVIFEKE